MEYCPKCRGDLIDRFVETEHRSRLICDACGYIHYINPKIVVGALVVEDGKLLLIKRGIEPRYGFWGLPAGFLEMDETVEEAAARETLEETGFIIAINGLFNLYSRKEAGVVNVIYMARVIGGTATTCDESLDIQYFSPAEIPWDEVAFVSHRWAIEEWVERQKETAGT
jgi:ADP-ribose pyrophosphatase YjhB (NUDIX family)